MGDTCVWEVPSNTVSGRSLTNDTNKEEGKNYNLFSLCEYHFDWQDKPLEEQDGIICIK